ncbi:uncharacterized protein LOC133720157 isoform X2 [Rosa rugosa]|uniref:uncharacterized protein LOC133711953 isoform X2 n=1 Tax=Rosa rugosa TaxID=74645 RepID=UPI002B417F62|nr:uncharacterized protein LOC133711953 isoform X2 [Rosa rugosa]XP_062002312.1 uncharacterized protein LOC133720157 isoform X2 [Rosa rugosa]
MLLYVQISPRSRSYATGISNVAELNSWNMYSSLNKSHRALPWTSRNDMTLRSAMVVELPIFLNDKRLLSTQVKAPAQARQMVLSQSQRLLVLIGILTVGELDLEASKICSRTHSNLGFSPFHAAFYGFTVQG